MLYQITNGTVSVGDRQILSHIDFEIKGKEKIAVVGRNGAGKSTLLRLIAGELDLDRDDRRQGPGIVTSRNVIIGMLRQTPSADQDKTVEELLLEGCPQSDLFSRERFSYEMEYDRIFTGFGFVKEDKKRKLSSFSGGEQTKISLIRLLLQKPDILLLDEPTNHLDIPTVEWLEEYMKTYEHAVVFVSHDRFFLDQVVDVVYELHQGKLKRYPGNYTHFRQQKQKDLALVQKAYERQQQELQRLNELIERFKHKPKKASFARSRKTIIERMEKIEKPEPDDVHLFTGDMEPAVLGSKWVLETEHLKIGYDTPLLEVSLRVKRGQKIGIIGNNGVGKTTFLKTVAGILSPLEGKCTLGNRTVMGYFDQQSAALESEKQVAEHFHEHFPALTEKEVRQTLGAYLFGGKAASVKVSALSGGEKARLVLAEMLTERPNFILLDEPTNHMDIPAKETLESAFQSYRGTMLFISHDRYFIRQVADAILVFEEDGVSYYPFGYEHYLERSRKQTENGLAALVQAEDQALIAGIRAVPKGERHRLKEIDTEDAYLDWRFRLAEEPMEEVRSHAENLWEQMEVKTSEYEEWLLSSFGEKEEKENQEKEERLKKEQERMQEEWEKVCAKWTEACLQWYEVYQMGQETVPCP
ncbi:MAG: ABC-F family ATP-binding cassette domain-containing protein [Oliverpabstia sp.]|nr:ABC-F family ATP-binding cassette domain-containing protein [Oliverpabstia sp.]